MTISSLHHRHSLRSRSIASFLLFAGAFGVALLLPGSLSAQMPGGGGASLTASVPVYTVVEGEDLTTRDYVGKVLSKELVNIVPQVSGELKEVSFSDGDAISEGQVLYRIDDVKYRSAVKNCEAKVAECQAKLEYGRSNLERTRKLFEREVTTQDNLEQVTSDTAALEAQLAGAEAALVSAREDLGNCVITSPISGLVGVTNITRGNYVTPSSGTLVTVFQVNPVRVRFSVSSADFLSFGGNLDDFRKNWQCTLTLADGRAYPAVGKMELVDYKANPNTDTVQLFVIFDNPDLKLIPNTTVTVHFSRLTGDKRPVIPVTALLFDADGAYVWLLDQSDKAVKRHILLGGTDGESHVVLDGLNIGDRIVSDGTHKVISGTTVQDSGVRGK